MKEVSCDSNTETSELKEQNKTLNEILPSPLLDSKKLDQEKKTTDDQKPILTRNCTETAEFLEKTNLVICPQKRSRLDSPDRQPNSNKVLKEEEVIEPIASSSENAIIDHKDENKELTLNKQSQIDEFLNDSSGSLHRFHKIHKYTRWQEEKKLKEEQLRSMEENPEEKDEFIINMKTSEEYYELAKTVKQTNLIQEVKVAESQEAIKSEIIHDGSTKASEQKENDINLMEASTELTAVENTAEISDNTNNVTESNRATHSDFDEVSL